MTQAQRKGWSVASLTAWGLGTLAALCYALRAEPAVGWFDAGELHAAAVELAPSHAPGQPLWAFLGKMLSLVPLGPVALRMSLVGVLAGVAAVVAVFWLVYALLRRTDADLSEATRTGIAAGSALAFGALSVTVSQAIRAEVYMPAAALVLCAAALVARATFGRDPAEADRDVSRLIGMAALLTAVAATAHPAMALCAAVPFAVVGLVWGGPMMRSPRTVAPVLTVAFGAATAYFLVALRPWEAHAWGGGDTWSTWLFHVRAGGYAGNVSFGNVPGNLGPMALFYAQAAGAMTIVAVAGAGALLSARRRGPVILLWSLVLLVTVFAGAVNTSIAGNPDAQGYVLVAIGALCALPGVLVGGLRPLALVRKRWPNAKPGTLRVARRAPQLAAVLLVVVTALPQLLIPAPVLEHPGWAGREYGSALMSAVPPRAILLTYGDHEVFPPIYMQGVEGARPDVAVMATGLLSSTWYLNVLKHAYPWLTVPYVDAPAPESAGDDFADTIHRGMLDANPELEVAAADSVFPVHVPGKKRITYVRPSVRRVVAALLPVLPLEPVAPDTHSNVPPGTWRGDSLVVERALYDAAIRGVSEADPRAVATLAILGNWPEPVPPARPDPTRTLNSRVERIHGAFLFTRAIALGGLGDALHASGRHEEADAVLEAAGEHGLRAVWQARIGDVAGAKVALANIASEVNAVAFSVQAGDIAAEDGNTATAAFMYRDAAERDPTDPKPLLRLGVLRGEEGDLDAAEKAFLEALERDPDVADAHSMLGLIYAKRGDFEAARQEFERALEIDPEHERAALLLERTDAELRDSDLELEL